MTDMKLRQPKSFPAALLLLGGRAGQSPAKKQLAV